MIDNLVFQDFGERYIQKYKARYTQALTEPVLTTGFGLGTRKGDYFLRTYKSGDNSFLKFELEIKKTKARSYHNYFLNLHQTFLQFENLIAMSVSILSKGVESTISDFLAAISSNKLITLIFFCLNFEISLRRKSVSNRSENVLGYKSKTRS